MDDGQRRLLRGERPPQYVEPFSIRGFRVATAITTREEPKAGRHDPPRHQLKLHSYSGESVDEPCHGRASLAATVSAIVRADPRVLSNRGTGARASVFVSNCGVEIFETESHHHQQRRLSE